MKEEVRIMNYKKGQVNAAPEHSQPLNPSTPQLQARALYEKNGLDFDADLREYAWPNGVIVDEPGCFAIAFATKTEAGHWCWFVKVAVGRLSELLERIPVALPFISFCRSKSGKRVKVYELARLLNLTQRTQRSATV
jgi:hypothetical protein